MKLGIISDTHDRLDALQKAILIFTNEKVEAVIHCGDWVSPFTIEFYDTECQKAGLLVPTYSVFGNNEGDIKRIIERNANLHQPIKFAHKSVYELELGAKKIAVYHGHDGAIIQSLAFSGIYNLLFRGHTHVMKDTKVGNTRVINPGSTSYTANSMITDQASVATYDTGSDHLEFKKLM